MGMFDSLKRGIAKFTGKAVEEAKVEGERAPAPEPAKRPAPAPAKKAAVEDDWEAELRAIEAEVEAQSAQPAVVAPPPGPAPKVDVPKVEPAKPAPAKVQPAAAAPAAVATPKPTTFTPVESKPAAPVVEAPKPAARMETPRPARKPLASAPPKAEGTSKGKPIQLDKIDDLLWDLELSLLESDVALPVVEEIKETLKLKLAQVRVASPDEVPAAVEGALRAAILEALSVKPIDFDEFVMTRTSERKPVVIMFVGVNGTGKTTTIGRIAHRLKENGYTSVMAAGDTFRAGAIAQLELHANKIGVTLIKTQSGGDPAAVAFDAIEHAKGRLKDVVLLDTAGRMQTNANLMDEMKKIKRVAKPDMIVFVGDSLAGNDAVEQAVQFDKAVGIDAVVLTKVDTDAKGGAALSIAKAVGKPILFLGVGQEYADLVPYDPQWMVDRIFEAS